MIPGLIQYQQVLPNIKETSCKEKQPQIKSYVILCTRDTMIVPIKAFLNPYNQKRYWAAGTPQFFGGSSKGTPIETMTDEVKEESRGTLELYDTNEESFFSPQLDNGNSLYFFYSLTPLWKRTGILWRKNGLKKAEREMDRLVDVPLDTFAGLTDSEAIIKRLMNKTDTESAPGIDDFKTSHTATAFVTFIKNIWPHL
jgi:hypothetical protein